jgi:myo-inositol 2-dehydrogenase / D-chiro-inositol 1-dehydrogenase
VNRAAAYAPGVVRRGDRVTGAPVRVAVVGTGEWWGRQHAELFASRTDASLVAVVGRDPARTAARALEFRTRAYVDIEEMIDRERPDLVTVCLPNEAHFAPTLQLIRCAVPLLVEKPLVFSLDEADILIAEAEARRLFVGINFNHRYAKPVRLAADALARGDLGQLAFATWRFGGEAGNGRHRATASTCWSTCADRSPRSWRNWPTPVGTAGQHSRSRCASTTARSAA